jgi:5-methylcytosine-specific restriction endonuclease McrA
MDEKTNARMQRFRQRRRAEGARTMEIWAEIETQALIAQLKRPTESLSELVRRALLTLATQQARDEPRPPRLPLVPRTSRPVLSPKKRFGILLHYGFRCFYCGRSPIADGVTLTIDHVQPKHAGGVDTDENLVPACETCNGGKGGTSIVP